MDVTTLAQQVLAERAREGLRRGRRALAPVDSTHVLLGERRLINFCSNDYLGLCHHPRVVEAAREGARRGGGGTGASGLISGYTEAHAAGERAVARWKGTEAAVMLPSGYQANHAAIQALSALGERGERRAIFLLDKLVHASLIDAVRGSGVDHRVYTHQDMGRLERLLDRHGDRWPIVVTESIFSMDGDALEVGALAALKARRGFTLVVDEAHGSGVYGREGAGWMEERGARGLAEVTIVTLSKALGCAGGAVCGSGALVDAVVNFGRAYIYSTSLPAAWAHAVEAALGVLRDEPERARRVRAHAARVRGALGLGGEAESPILPVVLRTEQAALAAADRLLEAGMLVLAIRPPTVARGTSRLRLTVSCEHTDAEIDRLIEVLQGLPRG